MITNPPAGVLFDLDGTLLDTAPNMAQALNCLRVEQGLSALEFAAIRPMVSHGSRGLIRLGFDLGPEDAGFEPLKKRFLDLYSADLASKATLFPGMADVLDHLEGAAIRWGIVTNKPAWLTQPLLQQLNLLERSACVISGDTTAYAKPHPEPLFYACRLLKLATDACLYVGDAERDIEAGRRAGMTTIAARYGYRYSYESPESWGADGLIDNPLELLRWL